MDAEVDEFLKPADDPYDSLYFDAEGLQKLLMEAARYLARKLGVDEKVLDSIDLVSEKNLKTLTREVRTVTTKTGTTSVIQ